MISDIFGGWVSSLSEKIFIDNGLKTTHNDEIVAVCQIRIGYVAELPEGNLKESTIKMITGKDKVTIRDLGLSSYEDEPTCSLFFACNKPPKFSGDKAIKDRLFAFYFCNTFDRDVNFEDKLRDHYPYFLSYILRKGEILYSDPPRTENMLEAGKYFKLQSDLIAQYLKETDDYDIFDPNNKDHDEKDFVFNQANFKKDITKWAYHTNKKCKEALQINQLYPQLEKKGYILISRTKSIKNPRKGLRRNNAIDNMDDEERFD
jgi:hypothetical protein